MLVQREWLVRAPPVFLFGPLIVLTVGAVGWQAAQGDAPLWAVAVAVPIAVLLAGGNIAVWRDADAVRIGLWPWHTRHVPLTQVVAARVVTYRPLRDYGGWGLKRGAGGWAFTVWGRRGVRLDLQDGSHVLIGSRDPEALLQRLALPQAP